MSASNKKGRQSVRTWYHRFSQGVIEFSGYSSGIEIRFKPSHEARSVFMKINKTEIDELILSLQELKE